MPNNLRMIKPRLYDTEPVAADKLDHVSIIDLPDSTTVKSDSDDETLILQQPVSAESNDYALNGDTTDDNATGSTDDTPLAILPDDEYDDLFANLNGSLLDELLSV